MKCKFFGALLVSLFSLILVSTSCKKEEITVYKEIPGNKAVPDSTVSNLLPENYVNKVYISVLGRKATDAEYNSGLNTLKTNNFSPADRSIFLDQTLAKAEYLPHHYTMARVDLLNDIDTNEFTNYIAVFQLLLTDTTYASIWQILNYEIVRLEKMKSLSADLKSGAISIRDAHLRCTNNYFYDQINMGTENFVVSLWQNFLFRYPTIDELTEASKMVNGFNGIVLLKDGIGKDELLNIFFNSNEYYEGQARDFFKRYLFREPSSAEMSEMASLYKTSGNLKTLQKAILTSKEYSGLK